MPEGIILPYVPGIGSAAKRAGLAIVSAPAALLAGALVLAGTNSAGGEDINESFDLGDYGSLNVTGHGSAPARTLTITASDGSKTTITGRLEQDEKGPRHFTLKSGTIEDRAMTPGELRYFSSILSGKNVNAVYSESTEDGEEGERPPPTIGDKDQTQNSPIVSEDGAILPPNGPEQPDPEDQDPKGLVPIKPPNRSANPKDVGQQPSSDLKLPKSSNEEEKKRRMEAGKVAAEKYLNSHEPFRAKKKVPRVRPDVEPSENPALYDQLDVKVFEHFDGVTPNAPGEGSMSGTPDGFSDGMKDYQITQRVREQDSAFVLKEAGYTVEHQPLVRTEDDLRVGANPDYRINGKIYDCYAPTRGSARNIWSHIMNEKIGTRQTKRVVLNLRDTPVTVFEMIQQFEAAGSPGLLDLIIIK
jgi:hypothetical protein